MANRELIVSTLATITIDPSRHDQKFWACRTGMCFGGWLAALSGYRFRLRNKPGDTYDGFALAMTSPDGTNTERGKDEQGRDTWAKVFDDLLGIDRDQEWLQDDKGNIHWLYGITNTVDDLYRLCAQLLGETEEELRAAVEKAIDYDPVDVDALWDAAICESLAADIDTMEVTG